MKKVMMMMIAGLCGLAVASETAEKTAAQPNENSVPPAEAAAGREALRAKVKERMQADRELYGQDGLRAIEQAYRAYSKSKDVDNSHLQTLLEKYPKANRTGCAVMYAGQRARGSDDGKWFRLAIEKYGDCLYGNGTQVGAYARFYLARHLDRTGKKDEAEALRAEILKLYPDARTHRGQKLADILNREK